jgi:NMD protein affecting ribosome stability and mRNA decay
MVRCSKCGKSFKQHTGYNWKDDMCKRCWHKNRDLEYTPPPIQTRRMSTDVDFYLDKYTLHEIENIDN